MFNIESFPAQLPENKDRSSVLLRRGWHWKELIAKTLLGASLITGVGFGTEARAQEPQKQSIEFKQEKRESFLRRYQKNFELLENEVRREKLKDKSRSLKEKYGGALNNFLTMHKVERDLEWLGRVEKNKEDTETFIRTENPYAMTPGSVVSSAYEERWRQNKIEDKTFSLEGLEQIPGFSEEKLQRFLDQYSKGYLESSMSGIKFVAEPNVRGNMEILGEVKGYSMESLERRNDTRSPMIIYNTVEGMNFGDFLETLKHEINHGNDWENSRILTSGERINMLTDVTTRVESDDRYKSPYVEGLDESEAVQRIKQLPDGISAKQLLSYVKASEYWAEIAKAYFEDNEKFKEQHLEDYELVRSWVAHLSSENTK